MPPLLLVAMFVGCDKEPAVRTYQIAKETVPVVARSDDRMLVGMIPQDDRVWFIKTVGDAPVVEAEVDRLYALIEDLTFDEQGEPTWQLPDGWTQSEGNSIRFATLASGEGPDALQVSVISLPAPQDVLANVNRWRGQLGLEPIDGAQLENEIETIAGDGFEATWIDLSGSFSSGPGMPPFAQSGPAGGSTAPPGTQTSRQAVPPAQTSPDYEVPNHWQPGRMSAMRKAAYLVESTDGKAEVTVITLPASPLLANVNRWRGQVGLDAIEEPELSSIVTPLKAGAVEGEYVQLVGEANGVPTTMLAVAVSHEGQMWFFKMMGDSALVDQEKASFEQFVQSAPLN